MADASSFAGATARAAEAKAADRVCDLLLHLETARAVGFRLAALIVHDAAGARAVVHCVLAGRPFVLSPEEARLTARCIAFEDRRRATGWLASLFETAACDAEAMALRVRPLSDAARAALHAAAPIEARAALLALQEAVAPATGDGRDPA